MNFFSVAALSMAIAVVSGPVKAQNAGVDVTNSALVMIEFVNEWVAEDGKLRPLVESSPQFLPSLVHGKSVLLAARRAGMHVIHVSLPLSDDYREFGGTTFGLRGAIRKAGTWKRSNDGWKFHTDYTPTPGEFVVEGRVGASAFANSNLDAYLRANGIRHVYLAGYASHVCVESTLRDAHDRGVEATVITDATAAFTQPQFDHFVNDVIHHFGHATTAGAFAKDLAR